jgi:hypothetical protein
MQTYTLQYIVSGAVDGTTLTPPLSEATILQNGIYQFEVENVGVFDVDTVFSDTRQSIGDRFIRDLIIASPTPPIASLVFLSGAELYFERIAQGFVTQLYNRPECIFVPQGSFMGIAIGASGTPDPLIVRFSFVFGDDADDYPKLIRSCCCDQANCDPVTIADLDPTDIVCGGIDTVTINGTGFNDSTIVSLSVPGCSNGSIFLNSQAIISDTEIEITVECISPGLGCPVVVTVSNGPGCTAEATLTIDDA